MATKTTRKKKQENKTVAKKTAKGKTRPISGLFLFALGLLSFAALLSYNVDQDSINNTNPISSNWVGIIGANFANWVLGVVGIGSWFIPVYFVAFSWTCFIGLKKRPGWIKVFLLVALPFLLCALAGGFGRSVEIKADGYFPSGSLGGNLGNAIFAGFLNPWMGNFGGTVILLVGFCSASLLILTENPGSLVDSIKGALGGIAQKQKARMKRASVARAKAKTLSAQKAAVKQTTKEDPPQKTSQPQTTKTKATAPVQQELIAFEPAPKETDDEILLFGDSPLPGKKATAPAQSPQKNQKEKTKKTTKKKTALEEPKEVPAVTEKELLPETTLQEEKQATVEAVADPKDIIEPEKKKLPPPDLKGLKIVKGETMEKAEITISEREGDYFFPPLDLLSQPPEETIDDTDDHEQRAASLKQTLKEFRIDVELGEIHVGPVITRYEIYPAPGVKVEKISGLDKNIAMALKSESVRILAPVPGKDCVGIEVPNKKASPVCMREIVESRAWADSKAEIPVVLGKEVSGKPVVADLTKMPHLLIAGSTGSGKSVCINSIIASLCYHSSPNDLRFIMVDPKVVEMQIYNALPHMLIPVVTEPKKVPGALKWLISEMTRRYEIFAKMGVRNIAGFNAKILKDREEKDKADELDSELTIQERGAIENIEVPRDEDIEIPETKMPYIVCIIDELADLMMIAKNDVETAIARIAQLARAAGIHLILATQRPSVNVITGIIKANLPSRIAFKVISYRDSMTILDTKGAEALIGKGDMLFIPPGAANVVRAQGAFVSDEEIGSIVEYLKKNGPPNIVEAIQNQVDRSIESEGNGDGNEEIDDEEAALIRDVLEVLRVTRKASTSMIQRKLKIGYNRAARIMDDLEERGIIGPDNGNAAQGREILVDLESL
ncbi:MAG: DNA translocase FtsK [Opitutae bacterium]|nr:DNA translocase FtsK [Opitutae bacterium]